MTAVLGGPRPGALEGTGVGLRERMLSHGELMVLNDEGHHLHTDELEWVQVIQRMDAELRSRTSAGLRAQFDFTATPKHNNGALFNEIVVDYPIAQAVEDGIVKRAILGELSGEIEYTADNAADRHRDKLHAGIEKWRQQRDVLKPVKRNPLLFVMTESTKAADEVGDWLKMQPDFTPESVLVIHTNQRGEIVEGVSKAKQKELEVLREAARRVDEPDNPYRAIVSVLMLREGWDVRNVTVIVPLRAYSAKSQILPEQTLGRGLRRMWPVATGDVREEVIVIEHEAFRDFWDRELEEEGLRSNAYRPTSSAPRSRPCWSTSRSSNSTSRYRASRLPSRWPPLISTTSIRSGSLSITSIFPWVGRSGTSRSGTSVATC